MANNQEVKLPASEFTEQTVANITEAGTSDFVAGYTLSGGKANRKFSLSNIANYVLDKFKLSLGGSRQTVKSAIDTLNSNAYLLTGGTKINAAFDFDSLTTPGNYYVDGSVAATHSPVTTNITGLIKVEHTVGHADEYLRQTYYPYRATGGYYTRIRNNSVWGSWVLQPTREEIDALNSNTLKSTDSNHTIETGFESSFCLFKIISQNGNNTRLVFHDNGKVEIIRYADGAWRAGVVLREADS